MDFTLQTRVKGPGTPDTGRSSSPKTCLSRFPSQAAPAPACGSVNPPRAWAAYSRRSECEQEQGRDLRPARACSISAGVLQCTRCGPKRRSVFGFLLPVSIVLVRHVVQLLSPWPRLTRQLVVHTCPASDSWCHVSFSRRGIRRLSGSPQTTSGPITGFASDTYFLKNIRFFILEHFGLGAPVPQS